MIWLATLVIGRAITWTLMTSGFTAPIKGWHPKLRELLDCDFCTGFWVYFLLAWGLELNLLEPVYMPAASEFVTGLLLSLGTHLAVAGYHAIYGVTVLD